MSTPSPSSPQPTPASSDEPVTIESFEYRLHKFWENYSTAIYTLCAIVLIAIIGKGLYESYSKQHENQIGTDYAAASTNEKLKSFAAAHPGHQLAGIAKLRLADESYLDGNFKQAAVDYQAAVDVLNSGAFAGRAHLGLAMSKLLGGQAAEAETLLKQIANDIEQLKTVRAEAAYQLASACSASGRNDEALKYLDQVMTFVQAGTWAQRAMMLRATIPVSPAAASATPGSPNTPPEIKLPAKP